MAGYYPNLPSQNSVLEKPALSNDPYANAPEMAYGVPVINTNNVVGNGFCVPYELELTVKKKHHGLFAARFEVVDVNGHLLFQVDGSCSSFQKKRVLRDPIGHPILTMRQKVLTPHHRWIVHRGESSEREDLLFSVQRSNLIPMKTRLDVFLASNNDKDVRNFQVVGCCSSRSLRVYRGDTVMAEVTHNFKRGSCCRSKECFRIKLYPGADDAFIVALIVILKENAMHVYL